MEVQEFGKQNSRKIMLLPGNMMSWRQFEAVIPLLEKQYHVIAVSTDGYDDTGKTTFTTAEAMAEKLEQYIKEEQDGAIDLVLGESMGGATAGMLFHRQKVKVAECEGLLPPKHDAGTATRHYRAFWQCRCRAAAAGAVLKPQGGNCAVLPQINLPVWLAGVWRITSGVPAATTVPPWAPPPGPISMM